MQIVTTIIKKIYFCPDTYRFLVKIIYLCRLELPKIQLPILRSAKQGLAALDHKAHTLKDIHSSPPHTHPQTTNIQIIKIIKKMIMK